MSDTKEVECCGHGRPRATCAICAFNRGSPNNFRDVPKVSPAAPEHRGSKYLRKIVSFWDSQLTIEVDIYAVLEAYKVTCPAVNHALKKLLMPGQRGKGSVLDDLRDALDSVKRAIELQERRDATAVSNGKFITLQPDARVIHGSGKPIDLTGGEGDYYHCVITDRYWGPKTGPTWGEPGVSQP